MHINTPQNSSFYIYEQLIMSQLPQKYHHIVQTGKKISTEFRFIK